jgi:hypothetical protein
MWWVALCALPVLLTAAYYANAWRNIGEFMRRAELSAMPATVEPFAGAVWQVKQVRLIGDGRDTKITLPGQMRILILRIGATATDEIAERWTQCSLTLSDDKDRRWRPVDVILSANIDRQLDPKAEPVNNCNAVAFHPPGKGDMSLMEEKFIVPADAVPSLVAQLSFSSTRPHSISFPLRVSAP